MPLDQSAPASVSTDSVMAQLLDEFTDQLNAGQQPDVDAWLAQHPELAATLGPVLDALQCVYDMSQSGDAPLDSSYGGEANGKERRLGDFRILREIGRGGMGIVYEAEQLSMARTVALKVLPFASVLDEKAITRFKNEARAAGTLHHPNIVPVHSVGNERGVYYYAMALIEGLTVAEIIRELHDQVLSGDEPGSSKCRLDDVVAGRANAVQRFVERHSSPDDATIDDEGNSKAAKLNACDAQTAREVRAAISTRRSSFDRSFFQQVARIGIQAGEALQHAHEHGIVHRDIKPGNLMIDTTGKLWVTDFGLARIATDPGMTMTGDLVGTLRYMAPEQALANRMVVDHRADIYSLGVTLYELTTLRPAFDAVSRQGLLKQLTFDEPAPPRQINPSLPTDLATIVCKAMSKSPDERYSSARSMVDDLRAFLEERPIRAKPPTLLQRAGKWSSRNRPLVASAVILLVLSTIGLAISNLLIGQERNQKVMALADTTRALAGEQQAHRAEQTARAETEQSKQRAEESAAEAYRQQYRAEMQLGLVDLEAGNLSRLYQTLVSHLPEPDRADRRGWEWYHLLSRCQEGRTLCQHYNMVSSLAWSPDGRYLATTSYDGDAVVWDARTGQRVRRFSFGSTLKRGVAWSPDSQQLAWGSAGDENAVRIWDRRTDDVRVLRSHTHSLVSCAWSPDGRRLATTSMDETARIWDPETGSCLRVLPGRYGHVNAACWVDGGRLLVGASNEGLEVWDVESGEVRYESSGGFKSAATTSTNPQLLLLGGGAGELRLIDVEPWQVVHEMAAHAGQVSTVAFSPDGAMFASSGTDRTVIVWDAAEARQRFVLRGHQGEVTSLAWNPTGKQIAAGCADGTVKLWDLPPSPHPVTFQGPEEEISSLIWSKDDRLVTALSLTGSMPSDSSRDTRTIWDPSTGNQMESRSTDPGTNTARLRRKCLFFLVAREFHFLVLAVSAFDFAWLAGSRAFA